LASSSASLLVEEKAVVSGWELDLA
jgi:hypothetical protein